MKNDYIVRNVYRSFMIVCSMAMISSTVGALVDNIVVGRFMGTEALGAMGVAMPVNFLFMALGTLCASGGAIMLSQALGQGNMNRVWNIFSTAIVFDAVSGVLIIVLGQIFIRQIASVLGAEGALTELTVQYLRGFLLSAPPIIALGVLMQFIQIDGSTRLSLLATITMTVSDIILDLVVVAVKGGMFGMAMATTVSMYLAVAVTCVHFTRKNCSLKFVRPSEPIKLLGQMIKTSLPAVSIMAGELLRTTIFNNWLVVISISAVAALNVRGQAQNIVGAIALGGAQAIAAMIAMFFGEEDRDAIRGSLKSALKQGIAVTAVVGAVVAAAPFVFPVLMGVTEGEALSMANMAVRCLAIGLPLRFVNLLLSQYYQSIGRTRLAIFISLMEVFIASVIVAAILKGTMGADGIWLSFLIGEILTLIITLAVVWFMGKRGSLMDRIMMLPDNFGGKDEDRLSISIGNSMDEVMEMIKTAYTFGEEHGIDKSTLDKLSLCIEELAGNIVQYAFKPGEKRWFDILIYIKGDRLFLRMRDNGSPFDPLVYLREKAKDDPAAGIGLKIINGITENFEYHSGIGLNVSVMTLKIKVII